MNNNGITVHSSLTDALREGFQIFDKYEGGYIVRRKSLHNGLWELGLVRLSR